MIPMMKQMTDMTQRLADMMASEMTSEKMTEVAGLMDAISTHILMLANAMNNGGASEMEIHSIRMGINETEQKLEKIK